MTAKAKLLIVDDQPANIRVMAEALRDDYELFFATSGERALEIVAESGIELVLLDVVMPGLNGFEICRRLKAGDATSRIPVIFVTAREEVGDEARGFDVGAVDYITKPIQPPIVRARVKTHIDLKQARDLLESLASVDAVTTIANRRRFDVCLETEWKRCARSQSPLTVAIADVDHFKSFNDTYGHTRGDECLRAVALAIHSVPRRPGDLVARYGGEEFGIVLPETDVAAARIIMQTMLQAVRDLEIAHAGSSSADHVTLSAGAATIIPSPDAKHWTIVESADAALYEAKQSGRNRVCFAGAAVESRA
jgi:diguanylate cyclase (GGDEF)-like protein